MMAAEHSSYQNSSLYSNQTNEKYFVGIFNHKTLTVVVVVVVVELFIDN